MSWPKNRRVEAFSLLDLMVSILILATLLTVGVPAFDWLVLDTRRTADINAFVASVQLARSEAAKRGLPIVLCQSVDGASCSPAGSGFDDGWLVVAASSAGDPIMDGAPLHAHAPAMTGSIRSNRSRFVFRPRHRRGTNGTVTFCDRRGERAARAVIVSYTGRPRVADLAPGGRPLACGV